MNLKPSTKNIWFLFGFCFNERETKWCRCIHVHRPPLSLKQFSGYGWWILERLWLTSCNLLSCSGGLKVFVVGVARGLIVDGIPIIASRWHNSCSLIFLISTTQQLVTLKLNTEDVWLLFGFCFSEKEAKWCKCICVHRPPLSFKLFSG